MLVRLSKHYGESPEAITLDQVKRYLYHCKEHQGLSNSFINQTISALKILRQDELGAGWDEGIKLKRPRRDHDLPDILSKEEIDQLIGVTPNLKHKAILGAPLTPPYVRFAYTAVRHLVRTPALLVGSCPHPRSASRAADSEQQSPKLPPEFPNVSGGNT